MSMHFCGWSEAHDPAGSFVPLKAIPDARISTEGDNIRVPSLNLVIGAGAILTSASNALAQAYIYSPTLSMLGGSFVSPVTSETSVTTPGDKIEWADYRTAPLTLGYDELCRAYVNTNPASSLRQTVFVVFSDGLTTAIPSGPRITWEGAYGAGSLTGTWEQVSVTWESELPPGDYGVIGMQVVAPNTLGARLNLRSGEQWRPGVIAQRWYDVRPADYQVDGSAGVWGTFSYTQYPSVEVFANTAAAGYVYLDLVQISRGSGAVR